MSDEDFGRPSWAECMADLKDAATHSFFEQNGRLPNREELEEEMEWIKASE